MKFALLTDTHIGSRSSVKPYMHAVNHQQARFFLEVFFPKLEAEGIKHVVHLGDVFDNPDSVDTCALAAADMFLFEPLKKMKSVHMIVGNHDSYYKGNLFVNSPFSLLSNYGFNIIAHPTEIENCLLVPWICDDNREQITKAIKDSRAQFCLGHFQFSGFEMYKGGKVSDKGTDQAPFKKFKQVLSGHFHTPSQIGNIRYIGAAGEYRWNDHDDWRGFHIFDTERGIIESIRNPYTLHTVKVYDGEPLGDLEDCEGKFVKLYVKDHGDPITYEQERARLLTCGAVDVKTFEDAQTGEIGEDVDLENIETVQETLAESLRVVELADDIDRTTLEDKFFELYKEAESLC